MTPFELAAHWKRKYERERHKRWAACAALKTARLQRDKYLQLTRGYEAELGLRKRRDGRFIGQ